MAVDRLHRARMMVSIARNGVAEESWQALPDRPQFPTIALVGVMKTFFSPIAVGDYCCLLPRSRGPP